MFAYGDIEKVNNFFPRSGFLPRFMFHGCTRLAVKLDFLAGLLAESGRSDRLKGFSRRAGAGGRGAGVAQHVLGTDRRDGPDADPWTNGYVLPNLDYGLAYRVLASTAYPQIKEIIERRFRAA